MHASAAGHAITVQFFLQHVRILIMAALRSRCIHYIFVLFLLMVALCNSADHYIFAL